MSHTRALACLAVLLGACVDDAVPPADESPTGGNAEPIPPPPSQGRPASADAPACLAASASDFAAPAWEAPRPATEACTAAEIEGYYADCLDPAALPVRCAQNVANHPACAACLAPDGGASKGAGPILAHAGSTRANVGGCIALAQDDTSPESCGAREAAAAACAESVCNSCDPGALEACEAAARQGPCATWQMRTCSELSVAAPCAAGTDAADRFRRVATVFCGR